MFVNKESLVALQVFPPEMEAQTTFRSNAANKDSLSLFALLNNTKTPGGKELLKSWLSRPSANLDTILQRHEAVECLLKSSNRTFSSMITSL